MGKIRNFIVPMVVLAGVSMFLPKSMRVKKEKKKKVIDIKKQYDIDEDSLFI